MDGASENPLQGWGGARRRRSQSAGVGGCEDSTLMQKPGFLVMLAYPVFKRPSGVTFIFTRTARETREKSCGLLRRRSHLTAGANSDLLPSGVTPAHV